MTIIIQSLIIFDQNIQKCWEIYLSEYPKDRVFEMSETERRLETELDDIGARHLLGHIHNGHTSYQQPTEEVRRHQSILREATRLARNERQRKDKRSPFKFILVKLIFWFTSTF